MCEGPAEPAAQLATVARRPGARHHEPKGGNQETSHALLRDRVVPAGLDDGQVSRRVGYATAVRAGVPLSGDDVHVLAEEQAALRRVATLVARGAMPEEVFSAVTEEVGRLLSVEYAAWAATSPTVR
jgi:hypothetical protein